MERIQDRIFAAGESDRYFRRNQAALEGFDPAADVPLRVLELYQIRPRKILEVGAANGCRLAVFSERYGSSTVACEPSEEAIANGRERYPSVEFVQGVANNLPVAGLFDLVIVNFVFHWIDRSTLFASIAEVDRVLEEGGLLLLGDFLPDTRMRVPYHHLPGQGVYTYKQDYAAVFLASGLYQLVCLLTSDHSAHALRAQVPEDHRVGTWLLRKVGRKAYLDHALSS